jgi:hypothetical protein
MEDWQQNEENWQLLCERLTQVQLTGDQFEHPYICCKKHIPQSAVCNLLRLTQSESRGSCLQKSREHSNFHNGFPPISGTTTNLTAQLNILCTRCLCSLYLIPVYQYTSSPGPSQSGQVPSFDSYFMSSLLSN